ncbi:hypothetical protein ACEU6E_04850 [Halorutilales archaeon Cl-col2-1]
MTNEEDKSTLNSLIDPKAAVSSEVEGAESVLRIVSDRYWESLEDIAEEVSYLSHEERFRESIEYIEETELDLSPESLLTDHRDRLRKTAEVVASRAETTQREVLDGILFKEEATENVLMTVLLHEIQEVSDLISKDISRQNEKQVVSVLVSLLSRIHLIVNDRAETENEETILDIALGKYYLSELSGRPQPKKPSELSIKKVRKGILVYGAVLAYQNSDISVARGAELAHVDKAEFEKILSQYSAKQE